MIKLIYKDVDINEKVIKVTKVNELHKRLKNENLK